MKIQAPKLPRAHPDYDLSCEEAIDDMFLASHDAMREASIAAGWAADSVDRALLDLAKAYSVPAGAPGD